MNAMTDTELIQAYVERQSETAFAELVNRHLGFVYSSALRQVENPDLAADVAQSVFLLLARKAPVLRREVLLLGWLFRTTRFIAARARRSEQRRQHREHEAAAMNLQIQSSPQDEALWREISPHLDDAIAALSEVDRRAVLLRLFERKPLREVGGQLGLSEDAAKKRVSRALDKLRAFLTHRGATLSSASLGTLLVESSGHAVPSGLAATICTTAAGTTAASATVAGLVAGGVRDWLWLKARTFAPWAAGVAALGLGTVLLVSKPEPQIPSPALTNPLQAEGSIPSLTSPTPAASRRTATTVGEVERYLFLNVRDKLSNQPISDARVLAQPWGMRGVNRSSEMTTDADGSCVTSVPSEPFSTLRLWLSAPGYVPLMVDWQAHEFSAGDVFHICRLTRGATLTGEVRDEDGQPVVGAKVQVSGPGIDMTRRENIGFHTRFSTRKTDETGRFQLDQLPPEWEGGGNIAVGVTHPEFAPEMFWLRDATQLETNHLVTLTRGVMLSGQVVGPRGDPVPDASVQEDEKMFGAEAKTDHDGRFVFAHVKPGPYTLTVRANGYAQFKKTVLAETNGSEATFQLEAALPGHPVAPSPTHLVGTVVDAENVERIPRFRVLLNERRGVSDRLLGEGVNGAFDWTTEMLFVREFSLIVEADGYQPQESDVRQLADREQRFEFRLKRGLDLTGVVLQPDGQPAAGAALGLAAAGKFTLRLIEGGKLVNYGHPVNRATTDERGRFTLRRMVSAEQVQVVHASGCAVVPVDTVTNVLIPLQPWGEIEGVLFVGSNRAPNQSVNVGFGAVPGQEGLIPFDYNVKTDADGKFRFTHVPPGVHRVQRLTKFFKGTTGSIGFSHGETVTVHPGETTRVKLGGKGIAVVGVIKMSRPLPDYDWSLDLHALIQQRLDLPEVRWEDFQGDHQAHLRARSARESQIAKYYLAIKPDGSFRVEDVLPGNYTLQVTIKSPPEDPLAEDAWMKPRREIGKLELPVAVPEAATGQPMNLGALTISITNLAPATAAQTTKKALLFPGNDDR
jgi:RNA polymerase sigma factor (sigma-70 family)